MKIASRAIKDLVFCSLLVAFRLLGQPAQRVLSQPSGRELVPQQSSRLVYQELS